MIENCIWRTNELKLKGKLGIFSIFFSVLITIMFWSFEQPVKDLAFIGQVSQLLGTLALLGFAWNNFISTRQPILDKLFDGLDQSYIYHKYLSIISLALAMVHAMTIGMSKAQNLAPGTRPVKSIFIVLGSPSMTLFIILVIVAFMAKKIDYEKWKSIHKLVLIPYVIALFHYYGSSSYVVFGVTPFSLWINIVNAIGVISAVYSLFIYEKSSFKYRYKVVNTQFVAKGMLQISGKPIGENLNYKAGQFAFLKFVDAKLKFPSHPFTISEAPHKDEIQFTIKSLGDHTGSLLKNLKVGDEFAVENAHGQFNYLTGTPHQIWIAGGIGITPLRSFYQTQIPKEFSIDFFYAYNNDQEGAYVEEINSLPKRDNFRVHLYDSSKIGFLTAAEVAKHMSKDVSVDVYFCGPKPMRESLRKGFETGNLKVNALYFEEFQFR